MRNEAHTILFGHPGDPTFLTDSAHFRDVRLNNIEGSLLDPRCKRLPAGQNLAPSDLDRRQSPQCHVVFQIVWYQRLFKPVNIVLSQHVRSSQSPLIVLWPEGIARPGVHHQQSIRPHGLACSTHNLLIQRVRHASKWTPTDLESPEALSTDRG